MNVLRNISCVLVLLSLNVAAADLPEELLHAPIHLISGEQTSLAMYQGQQPVYLKFWATWCQPCRKQMPHFEHVQQQYGDDIEVIGINLGLNDDLASVNETIKEFGLTMPMAIDVDGDLAQKFRLIGTPYHLLFDREMNLVHTGHEADPSLDNKLALLAGSNASVAIDPQVLVESEADISFDADDGKLHALFFTATWCDWYLSDSRPEMSQRCIAAQKTVNELYQQYPQVEWLGVVSRLWTVDNDLSEYQEKYAIAHPIEIDKSNRLFHRYTIQDIPVLLVIKNNEVLFRLTNFDEVAKIDALLSGIN